MKDGYIAQDDSGRKGEQEGSSARHYRICFQRDRFLKRLKFREIQTSFNFVLTVLHQF